MGSSTLPGSSAPAEGYQNHEDVFVDIALDDDSDSSQGSADVVDHLSPSSTEASGTDSDPGTAALTRGAMPRMVRGSDIGGDVLESRLPSGGRGAVGSGGETPADSPSGGFLSSYSPSFSAGRYRRGGFWV
jgi:hypothetical protein